MLRNQYLEHEIFCFIKIKSILNVFYLTLQNRNSSLQGVTYPWINVSAYYS